MESSHLEVSMIDTLKQDLSKVTTDLSEVGLDKIIDDGVIKELPVISAIIGLIKTGFNIKDLFFVKKLLRFIFNLKDVSWEERLKFIQKHYKGKEASLGEKLLFIIERYDDLEKPVILANLFKAQIREYINSSQFLRLATIVDKCFIEDLYYLKLNKNEEYIKGIEAFALANVGLAEIGIVDGGSFGGSVYGKDLGGISYCISDLGKLLIKYGLEDITIKYL